jgi:uncharacterized membrane protein YgdD (TMEM256/DUF423 family)
MFMQRAYAEAPRNLADWLSRINTGRLETPEMIRATRLHTVVHVASYLGSCVKWRSVLTLVGGTLFLGSCVSLYLLAKKFDRYTSQLPQDTHTKSPLQGMDL